MAPLPNPMMPVRLAVRLVSGAVSVATAPARVAVAVLEALVDEASERLAPAERPPAPGATAANPAFGPPDDLDAGAGRPAAVTPSVARVPSSKRRRTRMREPGPPVALPGLLEPTQERWAQGLGDVLEEPSAASGGADALREGAEQAAGANARGDAPERAAEPAAGAESLGDTPLQTAAPGHVDAGETLVAELADPGAEEGAGAELHVDEPWQRYDALSAADVVDRLPAQDAAALSVVLLYERAHRGRKTVIDAAERELARRA